MAKRTGCYDPKEADQIYQLGKPSIARQNFGRVPIRIENKLSLPKGRLFEAHE